jgi:hypothetical protein
MASRDCFSNFGQVFDGMNPTLEGILAKAEADPDFANKTLSATRKEEVVAAVSSLGFEVVVEGAAADRGEPLTEGELAGITGGASQMSIADLIGAVLQMAADKGDIHVKGNIMDISEKIFKDRMSSIRSSISQDLD